MDGGCRRALAEPRSRLLILGRPPRESRQTRLCGWLNDDNGPNIGLRAVVQVTRQTERRYSEDEEPEGARKGRIAAFVVLGVLLVIAYAASALAYRQSIDQTFVPPEPVADGVAVVLVPTAVSGEEQLVSAKVLIFPGSSLLQDDVLTKDVQVTISPTTAGGSVVFAAESVPTPQTIELPAPGVIEKYPFDTYQVKSRVKVETGDASPDNPSLTPVAGQYSTFFNTPGWDYRPVVEDSGYELKDRSVGTISRAAPTIIIAMIFIVLILAFGLMAASIEVAVLRGRYRPEISTASWLTAALFALISLRNGLPGSPPLGSWMDILVYFWVIAVVMIITVVTIGIILSRSAAKIREEQKDAEEPEPVLAPAASIDAPPVPQPPA